MRRRISGNRPSNIDLSLHTHRLSASQPRRAAGKICRAGASPAPATGAVALQLAAVEVLPSGCHQLGRLTHLELRSHVVNLRCLLFEHGPYGCILLLFFSPSQCPLPLMKKRFPSTSKPLADGPGTFRNLQHRYVHYIRSTIFYDTTRKKKKLVQQVIGRSKTA